MYIYNICGAARLGLTRTPVAMNYNLSFNSFRKRRSLSSVTIWVSPIIIYTKHSLPLDSLWKRNRLPNTTT